MARGRFTKSNLLFSLITTGNLGDVIQPTAMEHLLSAVAPNQCFWYAHPWVEAQDEGNHIGEFFSDNISGDTSRLIHMTPDRAEEVYIDASLLLYHTQRASDCRTDVCLSRKGVVSSLSPR